MSTPKVTLIADEGNSGLQQLAQGKILIAPSQRFPDPADELIIGMAPRVMAFHAGVVPQQDFVPCDLAGPQQGSGLPGWTYSATYFGVPGYQDGYKWSFYLLSTNGSPQRLSSLAAVPAAQPGAMYLPLPTGAAPADNQVPAVTVNEDGSYFLTWQPNGTGADKNFTQEFSVTDVIHVAHNLGKYPAVTVFDSAGDQCEGDPDYLDLNNLTVTFSAPFSGTVTCN